MTSEFWRLGVIGYPIGHSLSPFLHSAWLNAAGLSGTYDAYDIKPEDIEDIRAWVQDQGLHGFNVTVPHKEAILPYLDKLAPQAKKIGAVNTVRVNGDGALSGFNTDGIGFLAPLIKTPGLFQKPALVIGAGGAARAIVAALLTTDCPLIMLHNRSEDRAIKLANHLGSGRISLVHSSDLMDAVTAAGLIVNTTTLGMEHQPSLDLDLSRAASDTVVYDIVYKPLETPLLKEAKARSLQTYDGLYMLIHQGAEAFRVWTGKAVDPEGIRVRVIKHLEQSQ